MKFEEAIKLLWEECVEANCWNLYASCDLPYSDPKDRDFDFSKIKKLKEKILEDINNTERSIEFTIEQQNAVNKFRELTKRIINKRFGF